MPKDQISRWERDPILLHMVFRAGTVTPRAIVLREEKSAPALVALKVLKTFHVESYWNRAGFRPLPFGIMVANTLDSFRPNHSWFGADIPALGAFPANVCCLLSRPFLLTHPRTVYCQTLTGTTYHSLGLVLRRILCLLVSPPSSSFGTSWPGDLGL